MNLIFLISLVNGYRLLHNLTCEFPKLFEPCNNINPRLLDIAKEVFKDLRETGLPIGLGTSNNSICSAEYTHYGAMLYNPTSSTSTTDLLFKNSIVYTPNTCYNVILHEALHSLGLDHTTEPGMMSYAVSENWYGGVSDDQKKLWLSVDDLRGISRNCFHLISGASQF